MRIKAVRVLERVMKTEIIALGHYLGEQAGFDFLSHTYSCDISERDSSGVVRPCSTCGCCFTRSRAFARAGIEDKQEYLGNTFDVPFWMKDPNWSPVNVDIDEVIQRVLKAI